MRKKISTTIYVTPEQADKLKLLHDRTKVPVAVYIREGIDLVLRHYAHLLPGQLPLVDSALDVSALAASSASSASSASTKARGDNRERPSTASLQAATAVNNGNANDANGDEPKAAKQR